MSLSNKGSSTGALVVGAIPFSAADAGMPGSMLVGSWSGVTSGLQTYLGGTSISVELVGTGAQSPITNSNINNNSTMFFSFTYRTTAS